MQKINITAQELTNLKKFHPKTRMLGLEGRLYLYSYNNKNKVLKLIPNMNYNKLLTINLINYYEKDINIDELVLKNDIASANEKPIGTVSDYIDGTVLSNIIFNKNINTDEKIVLLKKVGLVLQKMKKVRENGICDFYIGDLHEDNIIITNSGDIRMFDMDSIKIMNNDPFPSKYLTRFARRMKYSNRIITPNEYTDNFCFNMLILNALFSKDISKLKISEFYRHIDYLDSIGIDNNLVNNFVSMYQGNTENLYTELDSLKKYNKIYLK